MSAISITFGDRAENHAGMQILGKAGLAGFAPSELVAAKAAAEAAGATCEIHDLAALLPVDIKSPAPAALLIIRNGVDALLGVGAAERLHAEMLQAPVDKKARMKGRVVNKHARWNNIYADVAQAPDYAAGRGTVIAFDKSPEISALRAALPNVLGEKAKQLLAETNHYYDVKKCGIGFHGDTERKIVVCARLGANMPLVFQWFKNARPVQGATKRFELHHGDIYVMSEKTGGFDWKLQKIPTLRHAAGAAKYLRVPNLGKAPKTQQPPMAMGAHA